MTSKVNDGYFKQHRMKKTLLEWVKANQFVKHPEWMNNYRGLWMKDNMYDPGSRYFCRHSIKMGSGVSSFWG